MLATFITAIMMPGIPLVSRVLRRVTVVGAPPLGTLCNDACQPSIYGCLGTR